MWRPRGSSWRFVTVAVWAPTTIIGIAYSVSRLFPVILVDQTIGMLRTVSLRGGNFDDLPTTPDNNKEVRKKNTAKSS